MSETATTSCVVFVGRPARDLRLADTTTVLTGRSSLAIIAKF
jgi:hypothetical protein